MITAILAVLDVTGLIVMVDLFYEKYRNFKPPSIPEDAKFYDKSWTVQ
jgi:hypothetical protein